MKLQITDKRSSSPSLESSARRLATKRTQVVADYEMPSNEWRDADVESVRIRPGTRKWAWELKITPSKGKMLRGVLKLVHAFQDPEEGARRRLAKKSPSKGMPAALPTLTP